MLLVVFHTAGINEKKKGKKKICTEPGWATAQLSLGHARQGAGALGRAGVGARALGWALGERAC